MDNDRPADPAENSLNVHQRAKQYKRNKSKVLNHNTDIENDIEQSKQHMRIASSGRNPSDKEQPSRSDHNELASIDDRSFDPDHEPRREGSMKMKHSPSVAEILPPMDGLSDGASIVGANEKSLKRGSVSRSPGRVGSIVTDNEEEGGDYRNMNRENKHQRSNKKLKAG